MLNIAICDDNPSDIELLEKYISEYMSGTPYTIKTYPDGEAFLNDLPTVPFDIIFMDIVIREANGIDLCEEVNRIQPDARIIYQSAYIEYFKNVYKTTHMYFLLKPISFEDFSRAIKKVLKSLEKKYIIIKSMGKIKCDDITYIELINHDTVFYIKNGDFKISRLKTKELLKSLPDRFVRCHKSYIINIDFISNYNKSKKHITVENGQAIPIGEKYAGIVDKTLINYWGGALLC
ncbi:MAG: LytTR family DNA-binding domain-containing protein [Oscillospiraceae bacterium]|nr:LytTR family DNA-binding domain-containing protein [Oscillospiraceae bacterium]